MSTREWAGKFPRWSGSGVADDRGRFALLVPVHATDGVNLVVQAGHLGYVTLTGKDARVEPEATVDVGDVLLEAPEGDREGAYVLDVLVRDVRGAPVAGADVRIVHTVPRNAAWTGPSATFAQWSARANWLEFADGRQRSGPDGRLRIEGERLGAKRVYVDPPAPYAPARLSFAVSETGEHTYDVTVADGLTIAGRVEWVGGGPVRGPLGLHAILGPTSWKSGTLAEDGTFRLEGLPGGEVRLRLSPAWSWSESAPPSTVNLDVSAGTDDLIVRLKRETDPRDIGDHDAEVHGHCIDAQTGERLSIGVWDVGLHAVEVPVDRDLQRDVLPNLLRIPPVQRMASGNEVQRDTFHKVGLPPGTYLVLTEFRGRGMAFAGPLELEERTVHAGLELRSTSPRRSTSRCWTSRADRWRARSRS